MRNQWRLLLLRCHSRSHRHIPLSHSHFQVHSTLNIRCFSSLLHSHPSHVLPSPSASHSQSPGFRHFSSSGLAVEGKDSDQVVVLTDIFSKSPRTHDDIRLELESNSIVISHELVLRVLRYLYTTPDVARRFFDWVSKVESQRLSSKSYNWMLGILGVNGFVKDFWDLVGIMKMKGYGVSKGTYVRVLEKFGKEGLSSDLEKLKELYALGSMDNSIEKICSRVCKITRQEVWGDDVEKRLRELDVVFSSDLVAKVLENIGPEPNKALIFFMWIEEAHLCKHDGRTYNAMATVLGREDCVEKFWKVADEMRGAGFDMEMGTYIKVLGLFVKKKMIKDAVDLYEFAMGGANKPSVQDCTLLLRKIVVSKELDMVLFSKVLRIFRECGNSLTNATLDAVLKSLTSVGRLGECNKILKAMDEGGLQPCGGLQGKIAFRVISNGKKDEAIEFMDNMETSGCNQNYRVWVSFIEGFCVAGDLDKASDCFQKMVEKEGVSCAVYALELLINAYCRKNRAMDACKLLSDMISEKELKPWHTTYKILLSAMVVRGSFKEALGLLGLMKAQGYPPFLDPFIAFISKTGTADDAVMLLKAMSVKRFPSTSVFLRLFEAYFKAGRHNEAQDFLAKCPRYIRNHAHVLNLFFSKKSGEDAATAAVAA